MNICEIKTNDVANGNKVVVSLWVSGCEHHCKGCFQKETWDENYGRKFTEEDMKLILNSIEANGVKRNFSVLGGDPTHRNNREEVYSIILKVKEEYPNTKVWVWTGYTYEYMLDNFPWFLDGIDVLVDGRFVEEQRDLMLMYRGSANQRVIDVRKSLESGEVILYD